MKILIPTYLDRSQVADLIAEVEANSPGHEVFASCTKASASVNRNICLDQIAVGDTAIMIDDDVEGYFPGWTDALLRGLEIPNAVMVSARLLNPDGTFGPTCSECFDESPDEIVLPNGKHSILPTAAICFIYRHRFDPAYQGSGWEDNDLVCQYRLADPDCQFIQSNRCRLIHRNEQKSQGGDNWNHNFRYFKSKWPNGIPRRGGA